MQHQSRIVSMQKETRAPLSGFVRVILENGRFFHASELDLCCRDLRVGDTICCAACAHGPRVLLELRPPGAVPFEA